MRLTGTVKGSADGLPVENVIVRLVDMQMRMRHYAFTDSLGGYAIAVSDTTGLQGASLAFSCIGYKDQSMAVDWQRWRTAANVELEPSPFQMKEVTVRANPLIMRGDTLRYNLASFLGKGDVSLEDGLRRLPGVEVSESGAISYMGKNISHFYIEGLDMLGGRYSLATRNIPAQLTQSVEVLRNHNDRKIDKDEESDDVAINIRLDKKAKFRPFGQTQLGAGWREDDPLYALGLTAMLFTDKFQTICSAKYSNDRNFASYEMTDHLRRSDVSTLASEVVSRFATGSPPRGEYLYQRNGMATLNAIEKLDTARTVRANIGYTYENRHSSSSVSTTYYAGGAGVSLIEWGNPHTRLHRPTAELNYRCDKPNLFVQNALSFSAQIEKNDNPVTQQTEGQQSEVSQHRSANGFNLSNRFNGSFRIGKHKWNFLSENTLERTPSVRATFALPSEDGTATEPLVQTAQSTTFKTKESTQATLQLSSTLRLSIPLVLDAKYDFIETQRSSDAAANRINGWQVSPSVSSSIDYRSRNKKLYAAASASLRLLSMNYHPRSSDNVSLCNVYLEPTGTLKYTFSPNSDIAFHTQLTHDEGDILDLLTNQVQTDYRSTSAASGIIGKTRQWSSRISYRLALPLQFFTFRTEASWNQGKRNTLSSQYVDGTQLSSSQLFADSHTRSARFSADASKNLISLGSKLQAGGSLYWNSREMLDQANRVTTYGSGFSFYGELTISPIRQLELGYRAVFQKSFMRYSGEHSNTRSLSHNGHISFFPTDVLELRTDFNHIHQQLTTGSFKNFALFDASAQWKISKKVVTKLTLLNLLDTRHYITTHLDGVNTYTYSYDLCGRSAMLTLTLHR